MNIKKHICRCLAFVLVAAAFTPSFGAKPIKTLHDLHFQIVKNRPGVNVVVVRDTPKKKPKEELQPVFYVNGDKTVATPENDSTFFIHINNLQRWSDTCPTTYEVNLRWGHEEITRSFGIHDIFNDQGRININDTTILRKGLTEEALPLTRLRSEDQWYSYLRDAKSKGFTVISLSRKNMSEEFMVAADRCGIIIHARVEAPTKVVEESSQQTSKKKSKDKKKKGNEAPARQLTLVEEYSQHPSLCMATFEPGATRETSDMYLPAKVFYPYTPEKGTYIPDYLSHIDTRNICIADFSQIADEAELVPCLERTLCTRGVGVLLFSSMEQAKAWKEKTILGKFDRDEWDSSMSMSMELFFSNNSTDDIQNTRFSWEFTDETGFVFSKGQENGHRFLPLQTDHVATAFSPMAFIFPGNTVTLTVKMDGTGLQRSWSHKILYPARIRYMNEGINKRMNKWCKRLSTETDEEYAKRVNEITKSHKKKLFASDIVTEEAGDLVKGKTIKLSRYNSNDESVTVTVGALQSFKLKVPPQSASAFCQADDIELRNVRYGLTNKDEYCIVYAEVFNKQSGETHIFENWDNETTLERILIDDKYVPTELKELAEREDKVLQQIKARVIQNAKEQNLITDHTNLNVSAHVVSDNDEKGNTLNNYKIVFDYNVDAKYSLTEDYGPGRYRIEESHAAISMLRTITSAFGKEFGRYITPGKQLIITITGSADSSPIRRPIAYNGCYGEFDKATYYLNEEESQVSITAKEGITQNEQLAFMRAQGVHDFLVKNLTATDDMDVNYLYNIELPKGRGGQFRRIKVCFTFVDAF